MLEQKIEKSTSQREILASELLQQADLLQNSLSQDKETIKQQYKKTISLMADILAVDIKQIETLLQQEDMSDEQKKELQEKILILQKNFNQQVLELASNTGLLTNN